MLLKWVQLGTHTLRRVGGVLLLEPERDRSGAGDPEPKLTACTVRHGDGVQSW